MSMSLSTENLKTDDTGNGVHIAFFCLTNTITFLYIRPSKGEFKKFYDDIKKEFKYYLTQLATGAEDSTEEFTTYFEITELDTRFQIIHTEYEITFFWDNFLPKKVRSVTVLTTMEVKIRTRKNLNYIKMKKYPLLDKYTLNPDNILHGVYSVDRPRDLFNNYAKHNDTLSSQCVVT